MQIQPATWRDLNPVRQLEQACFPKDAWPLLDVLGVLTMPNIVRLKAVNANHIVGFIAGDIRPSQHIAWIATLGVLPEYRRRGIASQLLQACEERFQVPTIRLSVRASNQSAIHLYEKYGFYQVGIWPYYYQDGEDALVLEKTAQI